MNYVYVLKVDYGLKGAFELEVFHEKAYLDKKKAQKTVEKLKREYTFCRIEVIQLELER